MGLVWSKYGDREELHLRKVSHLCTVGQTEPLVDVPHPDSRQYTVLRRRCVRHMAREVRRKWQDRNNLVKCVEEKLAGHMEKWWLKLEKWNVRNECKAECKIPDFLN